MWLLPHPIYCTEPNLLVVYLVEERCRPSRRQHFPQRCHRPSRSEDVVIETFSVPAIIPICVLHHFGIISFFRYAAKMAFIRKKLEERTTDDVSEAFKPFVFVHLRQISQHIREIKNIHINVIVFYRHIPLVFNPISPSISPEAKGTSQV